VKLTDLLDPDWSLRSFDKAEHFAGGFALCLLFDGFLPTISALILTAWTAAVYEAGQTDTAYSLRDGAGRRYAGQPGFGFGLADLAVGILGALVWVGLHALVTP